MSEHDAPSSWTPLPPQWIVEPIDLARDLDGVLAVEAASFTNHWTREMFEWEARHSDVAHVFVLRGPGEPVAGYCAVWLIFDELHINNIAILPPYRRHRLGSGLLGAVLAEGVRRGARRATLEVRASNRSALALYERFGFRTGGVRRGYYTNPSEDALILWREDLPGAVAPG